MSRPPNQEHRANTDNQEVLEIIKEEQNSPTSSVDLNSSVTDQNKEDDTETPKVGREEQPKQDHIVCPCKNDEIEKERKRADDLGKMLLEKEEQLKAEFQQQLDKEINYMKERFNFILQNEQTRATYMLREAHRERKEKISALQRQLECKNLAGLMYVLASERHKSKLEKLKIEEQYTNYIRALQDLLAEGQRLILHLSRGYKTAERVHHEWQQKMHLIMKEFHNFVYHFAGGTPETNQYFFDMPELLKVKAPLEGNPIEDPSEGGEEKIEMEDGPPRDKTWWEKLEDDNRPFVVFGDMADFEPPQRREVLQSLKSAKTTPKKWKEYAFHEMFLKSTCPNADSIRDEYFKHIHGPDKWECQTGHSPEMHSFSGGNSRRVTTTSIDIRANMGSILKIIANNNPQTVTKATLLAARDSIELASVTKMRSKHKQSVDHSKVVLNVGSRKTSVFEQIHEYHDDNTSEEVQHSAEEIAFKLEEEEAYEESTSALGSVHHDSLQVIASHVPEQDHKINYEKVCPSDKCQLMQTDSFIRSLPPYMRASPFTNFEQTYEEYQPCSPEQLEILKKRIEDKKGKEKVDFELREQHPLEEWTPSIEGVAVQTSELSISLPPCTCRAPSPSLASSVQRVFSVADLIPVKRKLDKINQECFYSDGIQFDRFKVIGEESQEEFVNTRNEDEKEFRKKRLQDIHKVLKQHPSLCEIFQANIRC